MKTLRTLMVILILLLVACDNASDTSSPTATSTGTVEEQQNVPDSTLPTEDDSVVDSDAGALFFVNQANDSGGDGTSWQTAFQTVQAGLDSAEIAGGGEVWVAAGAYTPSDSDDKTVSIELRSGVELYGGFTGNETSRDERDWTANETILSGDIGVVDDMTDNSEHVVIGADDAIIDGFTVSDGYSIPSRPPSGGTGSLQEGESRVADSSVIRNAIFSNKQAPKAGGVLYGILRQSTTPDALLSSGISVAGAGMVNFQTGPVVRNMIFSNNQAPKAGAVYNISPENDEAIFINVTFIDNYATARGGAMQNDLNASPYLINVRFINNSTADKGGGLYNDFGCSPTIINALFAGNSADTAAAMGNDGSSSPLIVNATFVNNTATESGPALYQGTYKADGANGNNPTIINSIIWGNTVETFGSSAIYNWAESSPSIGYSIVEGGYLGEGNLDVDPLFNDAAHGDYSLAVGSPAINSGSSADMLLSTDIDGLTRIDGYDMGAFESGTATDASMSAEEIQALLADLMTTAESDKSDAPPSEGDSGDAWAGLVMQTEAESFAIPSNVVFVNAANSSGSGDGVSWETAYPTVQEGIDAVSALGGGEVWIAAGTYSVPDSTDRSSSITLQEYVALYGGFSGTETSRDERNSDTNITILSGDIGVAGDSADNAYHVVTGASYAILDGLTISDGYADGEGMHRHGGGLINYIGVNSLLIDDVTFSNNYAFEGGAIYSFYFGYIVIENSLFDSNSADYGGAIYSNVAANSLVDNTLFSNNYAKYRGGVVVLDYGAGGAFNNSVFESNTTDGKGGAVWTDTRASQIDYTTATFDNCIFNDNSAQLYGGAVHNYNLTIMTIMNSSFSGNSAEQGAAIGNELQAVLASIDNTFTDNSSSDGLDIYSDDGSTVGDTIIEVTDSVGTGEGPDLSAAAEILGISEQELMDALGPPPPDLEAAAETLGITVEELQNALESAGGG